MLTVDLRSREKVGPTITQSAAVAMIAAMITPALLILGSASLVASALIRMARVVDRARILATVAHEGSWSNLGVTPDVLRAWLASHADRARHAERSIALLYLAIVVFIATCLSIAADRAAGGSLGCLPVVLAVIGTLFMLSGGAYMVAESSASGKQINQEIFNAISKLEMMKS